MNQYDMDDLKKWLENQEEAQNFYKTDLDQVWESIDADLNKGNVVPLYKRTWVRWAASLLILITMGATIYSSREHITSGYALKDISPELAETEYFYSNQLTEKLEIIKASGADIDQQMYTDLDEMDAIYKDLMKDLQDGADNQEII